MHELKSLAFFLLCAKICIGSNADLIGISNSASRILVISHKTVDTKISNVRQILIQRLHSVLSGGRARQFDRWALKQPELKVISMHGVSEADLEFVNNFSSVMESSSDNVFSDNIMNLGIPSVLGVESQINDESLNPTIIDLLFRSVRLTINFIPVTSTAWLAFISSTFRDKIWFPWFASCIAFSGPAFIKWGQWASTRSDMFPESLCIVLSQLHSDAPCHSWRYTQKQVENSLGLPQNTLFQVFDDFDTKPLASGSIAQVHRASLNGTSVIAKVRHPNVSKLIDMDFRLMRMVASIADFLPALSWLHVRETVEQFSHTMAAQSHLGVEAHHLEVLNHNFRKWDHVSFPQPLFATSAVILETFEPGRLVTTVLDDYNAVASQIRLQKMSSLSEGNNNGESYQTSYPQGYQLIPPELAKFIVTTGLSLYLKMLLIDRQMHADLHPGNILLDLAHFEDKKIHSSTSLEVQLMSRKRRHLGITLVDAGMIAQLSQDETTNFVGMLCSFGDGNGRVAAKCALQFSKNNFNKEQELEFIEDMDILFRHRCRGYGTNVDVGEVLRGILGLIRKHKVRIDANYATLVVNCLCVESLARQFCPEYNVLDAAQPLLLAYRGLCYDKKEGSLVESPKPLQRALVHLSMPLAYLMKRRKDTLFFQRATRK